jgi:hypothetical protein
VRHGLARRVQRLEAAAHATNVPLFEVIEVDEHGRPSRPMPTRPDGVPIPVIIMPALRTPAEEDVQIMAVPEELHQRGRH